MASAFERRLSALEERLKQRTKPPADDEALAEHFREVFERHQREREEWGRATPEERVVLLRREIERESPESGESEYAYRVSTLEIAIAGIEGTLTPEQLWVARYQSLEAFRTGKLTPPVPTHEKACAVIASGDIDYASQPESLKGARCEDYYTPGDAMTQRSSSERVWELVSSLAGPDPKVQKKRDRAWIEREARREAMLQEYRDKSGDGRGYGLEPDKV